VQKLKFSWSVCSKDRVETNGRTDGRYADCFTLPANAVGKYWCVVQGAVDGDMLRHLANEVGDEWRRLAQCLGIRSVRQQAVIRNANMAASMETRRDVVYDMLTSWVKKMPRAADKVLRTVWLSAPHNDVVAEPEIIFDNK